MGSHELNEAKIKIARLEGRIEKLQPAAKAMKEVSKGFGGLYNNGAEAAEQLMIINQGLRVQSRKGTDKTQLWSSFQTSLRLLGLDPSTTAVSRQPATPNHTEQNNDQ